MHQQSIDIDFIVEHNFNVRTGNNKININASKYHAYLTTFIYLFFNIKYSWTPCRGAIKDLDE